MARRPRLELAGVPLHVIQRGNNRAACFYADGDRRLYLRCLREASRRNQCAVHAYVLMSNHVHLLVTPAASGGVALMMQDVGRRYVRIFNMIHGRTGTLWEGRYKSCLIDSDSYLLTCHRYIERNPVRAGLVSHPSRYRWSSYPHYAAGARDPLITRHPHLDQLAAAADISLDADQDAIDPKMLVRIRTTVNRGWALGADEFLDRVESLLGRSVRPPKRGRPFKKSCPADSGSEMLI